MLYSLEIEHLRLEVRRVKAMIEFKRKDFGVCMPPSMEEMIDRLEECVQNHDLIIDCVQDEIRSLAHGYTDVYWDEEKAEEIIDYYCRVRWF